MSFTLNILEHELEPFGQVVRTFDGNPVLGEVRHYLNAATAAGPATLYVSESAHDVMAAYQAGCYSVFVSPYATEPADGAVISVLGGESVSVVFDALLDIARRYGEWEREMDVLRLTGGTLQDILDVSESFLRNNVVVLDPALKLLAYTKGVPCDDPITVELIKRGYHTEENVRKFKLHKRFKSWAEDEGFIINDSRSICKYVTIAKSFKARSAFSLIAVMMCNVSDDIDYLQDVFGMFTDRVEFFATRDYPDEKPSGNAVDTFLKDLLSGSIPEEAVADRSHIVGIPSSGRFCLFYMGPGGDSVPISRLLSDVSLAVAPAKTLMMDDAVVVLCFNCVRSACSLRCDPKACPHARHTVSGRLNAMLSRYELTGGRSSKFSRLTQASRAYAQAREAYLMSKRDFPPRRVDADGGWDRIFSFDRYGVDYLASQLSDQALALLGSTYVGAVLSAIAHHDESAGTNNYEFLHTYLVNERRTSTVAEKLHMHRNNVSYRIGRIEEQFGIDASDPELRSDLLFAFRLREAALMRKEPEQVGQVGQFGS